MVELVPDDPIASSYADALAELEEILAELEDEALDVDILSQRVERASGLIRFCRDRITTARTQVQQIVADLDDLADAPTPDEDGDGDGDGD